MKELEITNFELTYDGMYFISWENHQIRVYLELNTILKMLEIEGLGYQEVDKKINECEPLHFTKAKMIIFISEADGKIFYRTSDASDNYLYLENITMIDIELKNTY